MDEVDNIETKIVFATGKFQLPLHTAHLALIESAKERAEELGVPLAIVTGPSDEWVKLMSKTQNIEMIQALFRKFFGVDLMEELSEFL